jgi:hypothetical protein
MTNDIKDYKFENLLKWGLQNGSKFDKLVIKYLSSDNRYVVASEDIKVNKFFI